jgi:hypothetical protein
MISIYAQLTSTLKNLSREFPLPLHWAEPRWHLDEFLIGNLNLKLIELSTESHKPCTVTLKSGEADRFPTARAYFELVDQVSVFDILERPFSHRVLFNSEGKRIGQIEYNNVFPSEPDSINWKYVHLNGVASHRDFSTAARAAALILIKQDRLLRSWFLPTQFTSKRLKTSHKYLELSQYYDIELYTFGAGVPVIGLFCFPKLIDYPFICGFGASEFFSEALMHAEQEMLQKLSFLWGKSLPKVMPTEEPTSRYHQDYYLLPCHLEQVRNWLVACSYKKTLSDLEQTKLKFSDITFVNITPSSLEGKLAVVKAVSRKSVPLIYGLKHPLFPESSIPHPLV